VHDALLVLVRQRRVVLGIWAGILVTATAAIFVLPPQYRAASKVLVTSNRAQISTSSERPTELIRTTQVGDAELNSQLEILRSRDLVESVLEDLERTQTPAGTPNRFVAAVRSALGAPVAVVRFAYRRLHGLDDDASAPLYWEVKRVSQSVDIAALKGSNVVEIGFTGPDPDWARVFVDRLTAAYVDRQAKMGRETEAETFFVQQSEILRQKLAASEDELRTLREKSGVLAGQQTEMHERLNEFNAELARTKIARAEQEERVAYLERAQGADGRPGRVATPELLQLEAKRSELLGRYQPESERVRDVEDQIRRLRAALASYGAVALGGDAAGAGDATTARATLAALKGKERAVAQQREEYRQQAEMLDAQSFDLLRLERQTKLDEEAYLSYVRTAEQSRLSNALEQSKMLRLRIVEPAVVPLEPVSPRAGRILFFALVGGLAVSVGVGLGCDQLDGTVKSAENVRRRANLEVLAVLPEQNRA